MLLLFFGVTIPESQKIAQKFPKAGEQLATSIIKGKNSSPKGTIRLSQLAGPKFPLVPGSSKLDANVNRLSTE